MTDFKVWECIVCGFIYDEALGLPEEGIAPQTRWEEIPEDWLCPECGVGKMDFEMIERSHSIAAVTDEVESITTSQSAPIAVDGIPFKVWECLICGWQYDESKGLPEEGIAAGTRWEDIPDDWLCPECGVGKADFEMVEIVTSAPMAQSPQIDPFALVDNSQPPLVIIGSGLAGYTLAKQFRALNKTQPVIMITGDDGSFYSKPALSTGFQKQKSALALVTKDSESMACDLALDLRIFQHVLSIDTSQKIISTQSGQIPYDKLVLATGSVCINPPLAGDAAKEALNINSLQDYAKFRAAMIGKKSITIIGAGLIGSEFCNDLALSGYNIDIVDPLPHMLGTLLPAQAAHRLAAAYRDCNVNFHFGVTVDAIDYTKQGYQCTLSDGSHIQSDLVISAIGVRANITLAQKAGIRCERGIVTNNLCQTSDPDIYAIGDCAEVNGHLLYYVAPLNLCAQALASTLNGSVKEVSYPVMPVTIKTSQHPVMVQPPARGTQGSWQIDSDSEKGVAARFVSDTGEIKGFALTGDQVDHKDQYINLIKPD